MPKSTKRNFSSYELNQLYKNNLDPTDFEQDARPVEYITGKVEFCGNTLFVDPNTLIPRPETEELVELYKNIYEKRKKKIVFADVGAGTGAIGISISKFLQTKNQPHSAYFIENSEPAILVCKQNTENILSGDVSPKYSYKVINSNLLQQLPLAIRFDYVFANLPYIPSSRIPTLDSSVKDFEPVVALDGGEDGLEIIFELLYELETKLKKSGTAILEVDDTHTKEFIEEKYPQVLDYWNISYVADLNQKQRFWICTKVSRRP